MTKEEVEGQLGNPDWIETKLRGKDETWCYKEHRFGWDYYFIRFDDEGKVYFKGMSSTLVF